MVTSTEKLDYSEQRAADYMTTLAALRKIVNAKVRGTLSRRCSIIVHEAQIVVDTTTEKDREWLFKRFPGTVRKREWLKKGTGRRSVAHAAEHHSPLRESRSEEGGMFSNDRPPRVEVWGFTVPHVCETFVGHAQTNGNVMWRCAQRACSKRITKTKARELGLLPPRERTHA